MKPACQHCQEKIPALLMDDITEAERIPLEQHIATCPECSAERERHSAVMQMLSRQDEDVPRHFFVRAEEKRNPWQLFKLLRPAWQAGIAGLASLVILLGIASISRAHIRSDNNGWSIAFGGDSQSIKDELLRIIADNERRQNEAVMHNLQAQMLRLGKEITVRQQIEIIAAVAGVNSSFNKRIAQNKGKTDEEVRRLVVQLYKTIAQERAKDLEAINLRLASNEATYTSTSAQTNEILDALLQVADLRLK
jgi:hypothetical protein